MFTVFAYGTLRPSLYPDNAARFQLAPVSGPVAIQAHTRMVSLGAYPALIHSDESHRVVGELVAVESLDRLDAYEGVPRLYTRETCLVQHPESGEYIRAFVYVGGAWIAERASYADAIPSGDWADAAPGYRG